MIESVCVVCTCVCVSYFTQQLTAVTDKIGFDRQSILSIIALLPS